MGVELRSLVIAVPILLLLFNYCYKLIKLLFINKQKIENHFNKLMEQIKLLTFRANALNIN